MTLMSPPTMQPPTMTRPEPIKSNAPLASRETRLMAAIVDYACVIVVYLMLWLSAEPVLMFVGLISFVVYQSYLLVTYGQTIGKKLLNIRIVRIDTEENGGFVTNVLLRFIITAILGFIPFYLLIDVAVIFREHRRCIHDFIAGTKVVEMQ